MNKLILFFLCLNSAFKMRTALNKQFINLISNSKIIKDEIKKTEIQIKI